MTFTIDFGAMDDVVARLTRDRSGIDDHQQVPAPVTGIEGYGWDPGDLWVGCLKGEATTAAAWLGQRVRAVGAIVGDVHAVDGAEGARYDRIRERFRDSIHGPLTRESLDDRLGHHSRIHHSEDGF